jgi:hypothetical protein
MDGTGSTQIEMRHAFTILSSEMKVVSTIETPRRPVSLSRGLPSTVDARD